MEIYRFFSERHCRSILNRINMYDYKVEKRIVVKFFQII